MLYHDYPELNGELSNRLAGLFKELLEQERRSVTGASDDRQLELLEKIERRETELNDDDEVDALFESHISPPCQQTERPKNRAAGKTYVCRLGRPSQVGIDRLERRVKRTEEPAYRQAVDIQQRKK